MSTDIDKCTTTHLLINQWCTLPDTNCPCCIWCWADANFYLDPPHQFNKVDNQGQRKCNGAGAAEQYLQQRVSKKSKIQLPSVEGSDMKHLKIHPQLFRDLFCIGNIRYKQLNDFWASGKSINLYQDKRWESKWLFSTIKLLKFIVWRISNFTCFYKRSVLNF